MVSVEDDTNLEPLKQLQVSLPNETNWLRIGSMSRTDLHELLSAWVKTRIVRWRDDASPIGNAGASLDRSYYVRV